MPLQGRDRRRRQCGILDPRVGERVGDPRVELGVRRRAELAAVDPLEVERVDARVEGRDHVVGPVGVGVELEAKIGYGSSQPSTFAIRVETTKRSGFGASDRVSEREPGLPQREVERRRLERPAPVLGLARLKERERVERVPAGEGQLPPPRLELGLCAGVVVDLLAAALHAVAVQHDRRAPQREVRGRPPARAARGRSRRRRAAGRARRRTGS